MCGNGDGYVLVIDQGTTLTKASLVSHDGRIVAHSSRRHEQITPRPGWFEQDPTEVWECVKRVIKDVLKASGVRGREIVGVGIASQRGTLVVWGRDGRPLYNAIVWRCSRSAEVSSELRSRFEALIRSKTGLIPSPYLTGTKVLWLLRREPRIRDRVVRGEAFLGTMDSWILWNLTKGGRDVVTPWAGGAFATDYSNASRTMLMDIYRLDWDPELLEIVGGVPSESLPVIMPSSTVYGYVGPEVRDSLLGGADIPVCCVIGDQQAALFGHAAFGFGDVKATYGVDNFVLVNTGDKPVDSRRGLITTVYYALERNRVNYALEGAIFITGSVLKWLKDSLRIVSSEDEVSELAGRVGSNEGVYFVPAFMGLGTPYWDPHARGLIIGITERTGREHIARAVLESIAYLTADVIEAIEHDLGIKVRELRADGGVTRSEWLMQFQADILGVKVVIPEVREVTSLGAAFLAGLAIGFWRGLSEVSRLWRPSRIYEPLMSAGEREALRRGWRAAISRAMGWAKEVCLNNLTT